MSNDPLESAVEERLKEWDLPSPSPELRERVLRACRQEMPGSPAPSRRGRLHWGWGFALCFVILLLLNVMEERRSAQRIAALMELQPAHLVQGTPPATLASLRARRDMLAALLKDPQSL